MGHTKGPWTIEKNHNGEGLHGIDLQVWSGTEFIAVIPPSVVAKREENAKLIAAAPELLENFEKAIKLIEHIQEKYGLVHQVTINDGKKLIQKAKGE